jgi:RNA polymerase sigma-70 factor (ECF subfamily)
MNASPYNSHGGNGRAVAASNGGDDGHAAVMPPGRYGDGASDGGSGPPGGAPEGVGAEGRTDEQLLSDYRHGDKKAFSDLVQRYQRELYHFLVRFLGNRASAEDVFQETFLQVHQSADQFDLQRRFRPWLFTIAANKARDLIRSQARRPANPLQATISPGDEESGEFIDLMQSANETPDEPMEKQELQQQVQKAVTGMPEHLREILLLSYFHQFPYKQISEILDIPLGTVKSRLHAAVAHFADRWKNTAQAQERGPGQGRGGSPHQGDANPLKPTA